MFIHSLITFFYYLYLLNHLFENLGLLSAFFSLLPNILIPRWGFCLLSCFWDDGTISIFLFYYFHNHFSTYGMYVNTLELTFPSVYLRKYLSGGASTTGERVPVVGKFCCRPVIAVYNGYGRRPQQNWQRRKAFSPQVIALPPKNQLTF